MVAPEKVLADWPARRAQLQMRAQFTAQGRIGVVAGSDGFNGHLRWIQDGTRSTVSLDGPLGVGGVRIVNDAGALTVTNPSGRSARQPGRARRTGAAPGFRAALEQPALLDTGRAGSGESQHRKPERAGLSGPRWRSPVGP